MLIALSKKPKKSKLEIISIIGPELLMDKFKDYVQMIERKYDFMTKYYGTFMKVIRIVFVVSVLLLLAFLGVGFALTRGWIECLRKRKKYKMMLRLKRKRKKK
jgi:hypothetical protein